MSLDVFAPAIAAADQNVVANAAPDLPAGFGEAWDISTRAIGEWQGFGSYNNARERAMATYIDDVQQKTGETLPLYQQGGAVTLDEFNLAQAKLKEKYPGLDYLAPLSDDSVNAMTLARMKKAHDDNAAFANRETTWGGTAGTVLGTLAAGISDPINLATLPLGGAGQAGIALRALEFAAISGGSEAITAASNISVREAAVPGSSKDIPGEIGMATAFGGVLGAGFGALGKLLGHGAKPLPTSVRDEVNAATSELQFTVTNPFSTVVEEAAHRDAVVDATMALIHGEQVRGGFDGRLPASVERLSELQIGEIAQGVTAIEERSAKARALLDVKDTKSLKGEVADLDRGQMLVKMRADIADVTKERADLQSRIDAAADPETAARLQAISDDLQAPGLSSAKAADLEQERATIVETLAASADRDGHAIASLQQEAKGLDVLMRRQTAAADRLQAVHDRSTSASAARRASIEAERATIAATASSQSDIVGNELRRAISRLAAEGYGVKLDRSEAQDLAEFVVSQRGDVAGVALSHVTETLISKARAARAAEAGEVGERFLRPLTFDERPDVERFGVRPGEHVEGGPRAGGDVTVSARDLTPDQVAKLAADPVTDSAVLHNLEHITAAKPDAEFSMQVRQADGSYQLVTRKLSDVMAEIDGMEAAAKEIEACAIGMAAAAE